jgi:hypothetical protein
MVRFFFDVHVPLTIADQLVKRGIDILTAQADHSATLPDHEILSRATDLGRTVVTSDLRVRALAEAWQENQRPFGGLVFAHPLQVTIGRMVLDLELIAKAVTPEEIRNQVIFLPL